MNDENDDRGPETEAWGALGAMWRAGTAPASAPLDIAAITKRTSAFARLIRRRNVRELVACALVAPAFWLMSLEQRSLLGKAPFLVIAATAFWVAGYLIVRGRNLEEPAPDAPADRVLAFERAQLARQASLLKTVRYWYLLPLSLGFTLFLVAGLVHPAGDRPHIFAAGRGNVIFHVSYWVVVQGLLVLLDVANLRGARKLEAELGLLRGG